MSLALYTDPELMIPQLRSKDAAAVIAELCSTLHRTGRVENLLPFYNEVISRELLSSTATPSGLAIPHARSPQIEQLCFVVGRSPEPVVWLGQKGPGVHLVFLFAVPENEIAAYLSLLAGFSKLTQDKLRLESLLAAPDRQAMFDVLRHTPARKSRAPALKT
jgi:mannitol/fructose-specific phosphotransferase system IIA component (Ntr-type)